MGYKEIEIGGAKKTEAQFLDSMFSHYDRRMKALFARTVLPDTDARRLTMENFQHDYNAAKKEFKVYADAMAKKDLGEEGWRALGKGDGILAKMKEKAFEAEQALLEKQAAYKLSQKSANLDEFQKDLRVRFRKDRSPKIESALEHCGKQIEEKGWSMGRVRDYLIANKIVSASEYNEILQIAQKNGMVEEDLRKSLVFISSTAETSSLTYGGRFAKGVKTAFTFNVFDAVDAAEAGVDAAGRLKNEPEYREKVGKSIKRKVLGASLLGVAITGGVVYGVYKIFWSDEKAAAPEGTRPAPLEVREVAPLRGIDNLLTVVEGTGSRANRKSIFTGRDAEESARQITSQVRSLLKTADEQQRAFKIILSMVNANESLKGTPNVVRPLVEAITELQKAKKAPEELASTAYKMLLYYKSSAFVNVAKDIVAYLAKNPEAEPAVVASEPDNYFPNKYTGQMTPEWMKRPFPVFSEMGFKENQPYVKDACAMIRANFRKEDWEDVAREMAVAYQDQRFEQDKRQIAPTTVPEKFKMHLEALFILMYANPEPGMRNVELPGKVMDVKTGIQVLANLAHKFKQQTQYVGGDIAKVENMWSLAAKEIVLLRPTYSGANEATDAVLENHLDWLNPAARKAMIDTSRITAIIAKKITEEYPEYDKKRAALLSAINKLFAKEPVETRIMAAEGVVKVINKDMTAGDMQEAAHKLAFEARTGQRGAAWKTFMDKDLETFFPAEGEEARNAARFKAGTAGALHTLTTHEEYAAARDALKMFILKFRSDREAGYGEVGHHAEPTPAIIQIAAEEIVKAVRGQEKTDAGKVSDAMLNSKSKAYLEARDKLLGKKKRR